MRVQVASPYAQAFTRNTAPRPATQGPEIHIEPPPPGYNPSDPATAKLGAGVAGILVGGIAGAAAGLGRGALPAIGGAVALGSAAAIGGAFTGLMMDAPGFGSSNHTKKFAIVGGVAGAVVGGLVGALAKHPVAAVALGLVGAGSCGYAAAAWADEALR